MLYSPLRTRSAGRTAAAVFALCSLLPADPARPQTPFSAPSAAPTLRWVFVREEIAIPVEAYARRRPAPGADAPCRPVPVVPVAEPEAASDEDKGPRYVLHPTIRGLHVPEGFEITREEYERRLREQVPEPGSEDLRVPE